MTPQWLESLGFEVLAVNNDPTGVFPHEPEPKPSTMAQLSAVVKAGRADIGFAQDADGERLGIVTESGERLSERSEEHTSELQSQSNLVCRLLLEKKKKKKNQNTNIQL